MQQTEERLRAGPQLLLREAWQNISEETYGVEGISVNFQAVFCLSHWLYQIAEHTGSWWRDTACSVYIQR